MRATLGDELWSDFVAPHANVCFKDAFLSAFRKSILRCVSIPHGGACPRNFHVDLTSARGHATLSVPAPEPQAGLGRDCGRSFAALPGATATWDDGVDGRALLCCLVFSVHDNPAQGAAMLRFCCSIPCTDCTVFDLNISQSTARPNCWRCLNSVKTCWHAERREQSQRSRSSLSSRGFKNKLKALKELHGSATEQARTAVRTVYLRFG